ncbi:MAG: TIGR01212 family radical SAM protein, partial [Oscillospiraceae bacterium]|nr:TIGR01212 family radical SAM protein [Oscillospiraceae bacterium]
AYIRRGYPLSVFDHAVTALRQIDIPVIVHVILGLPGETKIDCQKTIEYLNEKSIFGIKLQLLHVLEGTDLYTDFKTGMFQVLSQNEYIDMLIDCIGHLNPDIVIHRLTGDGPKNILAAPDWSRNKRAVLNAFHHEMKQRNIYQGIWTKKDYTR